MFLQNLNGSKNLFAEMLSILETNFPYDKDKIIKYSFGTARTRDASLAASRVNYNAIHAEELKTKVVSEAAVTLNDGEYTEATSNAATLAKVDISGQEFVTQFWQQVKTGLQGDGHFAHRIYLLFCLSNFKTRLGEHTQSLYAANNSCNS